MKKRNKSSHPSKLSTNLEGFRNSIIKNNRYIYYYIRTEIGSNCQLKEFNTDEIKDIKQKMINNGANVIF